MKQKLFSLIIWIVIVFVTTLLFVTMLLTTILLFPFDKQRRRTHAQCFWWSDAVIRINPFWNVQVRGLENIDPNRTYIVVANHQSIADIGILYQTRMQFKWVAKQSLFHIPILGWCMTLARHIKLKRGNLKSIKHVYRETSQWLKCGMSVVFFPEGTRSYDGIISDFQNGAFKIAISEGVAVLPISINGTANAIPKNNWTFDDNVNAILTILPAIETSSFRLQDFHELKDLARSSIENSFTS